MRPRHRIRSLLTLALINGVIPMRSQPLYLINTIASPLAFLFFITVASHGLYLGYGVAGGLIFTMLAVGTGLQTDMTHYKQDLKFQDMVVASPVEAPVYVAGMALSEFAYSVPGMAVFVALSVPIGHYTVLSAVSVAGVLLLVWAFASALGFTLATYFEDVRETFVFSPLISLALTTLPPVYYPASAIPAAYRPIVYLSPTTYAGDLVHGALGLGPPLSLSTVAIDWTVLVGFTVALFVIAAVKARWREP
jgi:ABC-2 type transport system permease protein